ncbi:MAG: glycoside hydrolase family 3 N-terminal domain-containing protein [Saprospiraceae bacterium]|nr:glycoside hydrolase family 3 N-terminal domain-containing protein [Saprospiraceae bacterium]
MRIKVLIIGLLLYCQQGGLAQISQDQWVDSIYNNMTIDEKIGQLFMIRASAKRNEAEAKKVLGYISKYHVGGICFFQGDPVQLVNLVNRYQSNSKIPLLTSIDGEWGLGMRYPKQTISFPRALTLGAIQDNNLIFEMGKHIGTHCKRVGLNVNFAPVVDVNNNPSNPVINNRSFGEDKYNVATKGYHYMKGMEEVGVMSCAKHFPGHGDTDTDSHYDLPQINHTKKRLDSIELMPFRSLIKQGIGSVMVAHLNIPIIDNRENRPTTLSKSAVTDLLRNELMFNGLIYTDAMEMKGVTKHFAPGDADKEAFLAGNDIILLPENLSAGFESIKNGIQDQTISEERLERSVKRILRSKFTLGMTDWKDISHDNLMEDINNNHSLALKQELIENAITLVSNEEDLVPISKINDIKFSSISIGAKYTTPFQKHLSKYVECDHKLLEKSSSAATKGILANSLRNSDYIIVGVHDMSKYATKQFGIDIQSIAFLKALAKEKKVIVVLFGSPYALKYFDDFSNVIVAYESDKMTQEVAAEAIFGAIPIKGKLPVSASAKYPYGKGYYKSSLNRLGYSVPERVGMNSKTLAGIDTIVEEMIAKKAAPGCQVLAAKDGKIIFQKSYGHFTYNKKRAVKDTDIYDVASVTKVCASTISLMKLYDDQKFDLNAPIDRYIAEADTSNKGNLSVRLALAHHARLAGWIPFYKKTVSESRRNPKPLKKYYSRYLKPGFTIPVADSLFLRTDYKDSIWSRIYVSELKERFGYKYSDLAFYLMHKTIENLVREPINTFTSKTFYEPLGLNKTGYLPLNKHSKSNIAPSEKDTYFRNQIIQGHVHDMGAAMLGGVSGHAGLFSNAKEIAIIYQMLLNGGSYGGKEYIKPETVKLFTSRYHESTRRGLGFDMKELNADKTANMSEMASNNTFGHLGFTGIAAFADPDEDLIFIFVSNRTYPSMNNYKFSKGEYRPRVQSQIYKSIFKNEVLP